MPKKTLTFTFDNGPTPGATGTVLDFLAARGTQATFFVVRDQLAAPAGRALVQRAHSEGHWIGNHTLTHGKPLGIDGNLERVRREIGETERLLGGLAHPQKFFRPNGAGEIGPHLLSPAARDYLTENRFTVVTWNNVPGDWIAPHTDWFDAALATVDALDWSVLVLHDPFIARMTDLLARFCDELVRRDVAIVQDFPPSCILLDRGVPTGPLDAFVSDASIADPAYDHN